MGYIDGVAESTQARRKRNATTAAKNGGPGKTAAARPKAAPARKQYVATKPGTTLPDGLAAPLADLERELGMSVWVMLHNRRDSSRVSMDFRALRAFLDARDDLAGNGPVALVIDSPGGYADVAYRIARTVTHHAGGFVAVIPRWAKSAATLLTLGADEVIMAGDAEIGPLDVQVYDEEREQRGSALDEIQALEQLHQVALMQLNQNVTLMRYITRRRYDVVLPHASKLVSDMMAPMLDKIDTVHYAKQSRLLAVAEDYALRLMAPRKSRQDARRIAERLVKGYPEHGFVIDREEASEMVDLRDHSDRVERILRQIEMFLWDNDIDAVGNFKEKP